MILFPSPGHLSESCATSAGFVMSMYSLLRSKPEAPTEEEIEEALAGNLWCGVDVPHLSFLGGFAVSTSTAFSYASCVAANFALWGAVVSMLD